MNTSRLGSPHGRISFLSRHTALVLFTVMVTLFGCSRTVTVTVPPKVDLKTFPTIGVVSFAGIPGDLGPDATQKLLSRLQAAQPGLRLIELGSPEQVLRAVGQGELDHQAIRAIGRQYGVAAVLGGTVEFSEMRPDIKVDLTSLSAQAKIDGRMSAKLWDAATGATVWTNSSWGNWPVAGVSFGSNGPAAVGLRTPAEQRDRILMALIRALDGDFWATSERRRIER